MIGFKKPQILSSIIFKIRVIKPQKSTMFEQREIQNAQDKFQSWDLSTTQKAAS